MAEPIIRRANSQDFDQVWSMYLATSKELNTPELGNLEKDAIRRKIESFYVADLEGELLSQRRITPNFHIRYQDDEVVHNLVGSFMGNAYTLPDYRKQGLSTSIFNAIESDARDLGIGALYVAAEGPGMREWWQHRGAEVIGVCKSCSRANLDCSNMPLLVKYLT